jgi:hypothetical protein
MSIEKPNGDLPIVAPFESCIVCFAGDTTTCIAFEGEAEWMIAGLHKIGLPVDQAQATFLFIAASELGCEPGTVPDGRFTEVVRLCQRCAEKANVPVGEPGGLVPTLHAPEVAE